MPMSDGPCAYVEIVELVKGLSSLVGEERAADLVHEACEKHALPRRDLYTRSEFMLICQHLKDQGGSVSLIVGALMPRMILSKHTSI
jgi:hypothetical protein